MGRLKPTPEPHKTKVNVAKDFHLLLYFIFGFFSTFGDSKEIYDE